MMQNIIDKGKHYKATLKDKELEEVIFQFLNKLSKFERVNVSIMFSGEIEKFLDGKILKCDPSRNKFHFYHLELDVPTDHNISFHQFQHYKK